MNCKFCNSSRVLHITSKCDDRFSCYIEDKEYSGYPMKPFTNGYVRLDICLSCQKVQQDLPKTFDFEVDKEMDF